MDHSIFLIMTFAPTGTFADMLHNSPSNRIEHLSIQTLLRQCLYALKFLHRNGISQRSIRPKSLLILFNEPLRLKLCNLGPPSEQSNRSSYIDPGSDISLRFFRADIWKLGVVALNAFGYWPFELPTMDTCLSREDIWSTPPATLPELQYLPCTTLLQGMFRTYCRDRSSAVDCLQDPWLELSCVRKRQGSATTGNLQVARRRNLAAVVNEEIPQWAQIPAENMARLDVLTLTFR